MDKPVEKFKRYCKDNELRFTTERQMILEEMYRKDGHFDVDALYVRLRERHPRSRVSKASVYRSVPHFIDAGLLRESYSQDGHACYEHVLGHTHHDHIKCLKCGRVSEFYDKRIDEAQEELMRKRGFKMMWHMHVIAGICASCAKKKGSRAKK